MAEGRGKLSSETFDQRCLGMGVLGDAPQAGAVRKQQSARGVGKLGVKADLTPPARFLTQGAAEISFCISSAYI